MLSRTLATVSPAVPSHHGAAPPAAHQHRAAAELEDPLHLDHPPDVRRVARAAVVEDVLPDRVELVAEQLELLGVSSRVSAGGRSTVVVMLRTVLLRDEAWR